MLDVSDDYQEYGSSSHPQVLRSLEHQDKVIEVIRVAWSKVHEEIMSWSFWLKMEAFVNMVVQRPLLMLTSNQDTEIGAYVTEVSSVQFEVVCKHSGRPICSPPRLSKVFPVLPLKQLQCLFFLFFVVVLFLVFLCVF